MKYNKEYLGPDYEQDLKYYLMGNLPTDTAKPKKFELSDFYKKQLIAFFEKTSLLYGVEIKRVRFDTGINKEGEMKLFELNLRNPLGLATGAEVLSLWNINTKPIDEVIVSIFKGKTAVLMNSEFEFSNSELNYMEKLLQKKGIDVIVCSFEECEKHINNMKYVIWYTKGDEAKKESIKPFSVARNCYGGLGYLETKADLTFKNYPNSPLIMDGTEIIQVNGEYIVPDGKVAKFVAGPKSSGGNGVFFAGEKFKAEDETILLQDKFSFDYPLDINVFKIGDKYKFVCFQRFGGVGEKLANLSQRNGGYYQVLY